MFRNAQIETDRLVIRPLIESDAEPFFNMATEPNHFTYMPDAPPNSIQEVHQLIKWSQGCNEKNTKEKIHKFNLSIILKDTGEFIGVCGLGPHDVFPDNIEIYYSLTKRYQGNGYAKEAANAIFDYGWHTIGLTEMIATVHPDNISSVNIIKGLGMRFIRELSGLKGELEEYNGYRLYEAVKE